MIQNKWSQDSYIKAYKFAANAHRGQMVPGTDIPYIMHLSFVSMEIISALNAEQGHDENLAVQCALLHDVTEDTGVSYEQLSREFGTQVADGVAALSKNKGIIDKDMQMDDSLRRIRQQPKEVWMVKLADRITNLQPPPSHWTKTRAKQYLAEARKIHTELKEASDALASRLLIKIEEYKVFVE